MNVRLLIFLACAMAGSHRLPAQTFPTGERTHWNVHRGYAPFRHSTQKGIVLRDTLSSPISDSYKLPATIGDCRISFRASNRNNHPAKSYEYVSGEGKRIKVKHPGWAFFVVGESSDTLIFNIRSEEVSDGISSEMALAVSAYKSEIGETVERRELKDGVDCLQGVNIWSLAIKSGDVSLSVGNRSLQEVFSLTGAVTGMAEFGFMAMPGADLLITDITLAESEPGEGFIQTGWSNPDHLRNYLSASEDPMEGYWTIFDRTLEESLLQLGGDYRFAMVKDGEEYQLIYLSGARINAGRWKPGIVKARLKPDYFPGIYDVEWVDAEGNKLSNSIKAQIGEGETLTIQFPYHASTIRLRRLPQQ